MAALDRSVLDAQVCSAKADACGTPQLRVVRAANLPVSGCGCGSQGARQHCDSMHWFPFLFAALNTAPASLLCPRVHWQSLAELVYLIIRVPSDSHRPAKVAGSRLRNVFVYGGQLVPHSLRSSTEGPACSPGLMPRSMGLLTRAGICCREV
jgi:hypothetical protein